jgi:CheY-like chemotaxis protein
MPEEDSDGIYAINAVAEMTGVPATTLRYWEKAYGVIKPTRTEGGHRLYSKADVERIKWLKHKIEDEGLQAAAAHKMLERTLRKIDGIAENARSRGAILILVAEKDPVTADLEHYFLSQEGYDIHVVLDGRKAIEIARELHPHLIILEVILPGVSGLKVCEAIKNDPITADIPVMVFSVLDVRDRALGAGADAFLLKPIEQSKLIDTVKALLQKSVSGGVSVGQNH